MFTQRHKVIARCVRVTELDVPVHEIANRLHARPAGRV